MVKITLKRTRDSTEIRVDDGPPMLLPPDAIPSVPHINDTKPCIICKCELESVMSDWNTMQPNDGGEVKFIFAFGSAKFDLAMHGTVFQGVICDTCAEQCVERMERIDGDG